MSRVGARREREGTVPRATAVPRLAKPARHAGYAPGAHRSIGSFDHPRLDRAESRPRLSAVTRVDKAGIVARVARVLADRGVNVTALSTQSRPEPETGTPIYTMRIRMAVPRAVDRRALRTELERVAAELRVELTLTERDSAE